MFLVSCNTDKCKDKYTLNDIAEVKEWNDLLAPHKTANDLPIKVQCKVLKHYTEKTEFSHVISAEEIKKYNLDVQTDSITEQIFDFQVDIENTSDKNIYIDDDLFLGLEFAF